MNREIWTLPAQGGDPARLTKDPQGVVNDSPVFAPDGRGIVHRSNRGGASNIWWQPLNANSPVQLTSGPGPDSYPASRETEPLLSSIPLPLLFAPLFPAGRCSDHSLDRRF